jgi:hypothetical protein
VEKRKGKDTYKLAQKGAIKRKMTNDIKIFEKAILFVISNNWLIYEYSFLLLKLIGMFKEKKSKKKYYNLSQFLF